MKTLHGSNFKRGSVLILVLWTLGILSVFAVNIGLLVQQKIRVLSRLDRRAGARAVAASGVYLARSIVTTELHKEGGQDLSNRKSLWFNMPELFRGIRIGQGRADISYLNYDLGFGHPFRMYGITDEERKLNINKASKEMLDRLVKELFKMDDEQADDIISAIIDWREYGQSEIVGFFSDEYYDNLEFKYPEKKADFENIDELGLVRGIHGTVLEVLSEFLTVYGDGAVNINTASRPVLKGLGLTDEMINTVFFIRTGRDAMEATPDDIIFLNPPAILPMLSSAVTLSDDEKKTLEGLINGGFLGTESGFFRASSRAVLDAGGETAVIDCVFRGDDGKIVDWKEK